MFYLRVPLRRCHQPAACVFLICEMRIFIDGTETFWRPENRTGIQRVVREVCRRCAELAPAGTVCRAVQFDGRQWADFSMTNGLFHRAFSRARELSMDGRSMRRLARAELRSNPGRLSRLGPFLLGWVGSGLASVAAALLRHGLRQKHGVEMLPGDVLLILDYPHRRMSSVRALQGRGVRVIMLIYDCIPLSHPWLCEDGGEFGRMLTWANDHAEGIMTISAFSEQDIRSRLSRRDLWTEHFPLGADFSTPPRGEPRAGLGAAFSHPCFLMVGTIAQNKNQEQVLDAMEKAWAEGCQANLLIIGKVGWQVDRLLGRFAAHPERGRRLFVFHDLDDAELAYAYSRAHALVAASHVEGFGLPLVEALGRGLPVIASDIPVFREIVGQAVEYFPLGDVGALARILIRRAGEPREAVRNWKWPDWSEATRLLLTKVANRMAGR